MEVVEKMEVVGIYHIWYANWSLVDEEKCSDIRFEKSSSIDWKNQIKNVKD